MLAINFSTVPLRLRQSAGKSQVYDPIRHKWVALTPEEHVRQCLIVYLMQQLQYPSSLIAVEKEVLVVNRPRRFDVVIYNRQHLPWMLIECKQPGVSLTQDAMMQLLSYQSVVNARYFMLTNGIEHFCADAANISDVKWLSALPPFV